MIISRGVGLMAGSPTACSNPARVAVPTPAPNTANCDGVEDDLTHVGRYPNSPSPNGTVDQAGQSIEQPLTVIGRCGRHLLGTHEPAVVGDDAGRHLGPTDVDRQRLCHRRGG